MTSAAFSRDGWRIVSGSWDDSVRVWDAGSGKQIGDALTGHTDVVTSVAVSSDGRRIVSGSWDKTLRVWDVGSGAQVGAALDGHSDRVESVALDRDGRRIVSGSWDQTLRLWPGATAWPQLLCDKITANMSRKQWRDWVSRDVVYISACPDLPIAPD